MNTLYKPAPSPFDGSGQQSLANHLGMWTFLGTEILFFGGLFTAYTVYRYHFPAEFRTGSGQLEYWIGTTNTAVLLTSSLFMALADLAARRGSHAAVRWHLVAVWVLGAVFLGLKSYEYYGVIEEHHVPGLDYQIDGPQPAPVQLFMFLYFAMTGLHALHMLAGLAAIGWLLWLNHRGRIGPEHDAPVAMVGLYWHFVDCVWIFLYPLLYLVR